VRELTAQLPHSERNEAWHPFAGAGGIVPLNIHSNAYALALLVKTGAGVLYGFSVYSSKASAQFIQVHDRVAAPNLGDVPAVVFTVATTGNLNWNWIPGRTFLYGCWIVNSSTGPTYTAGSADTWFDAQFL
jgi:hypothetical protein